MQLSDIIASDAVVPSLRAATKKKVLQEQSKAAAKIRNSTTITVATES